MPRIRCHYDDCVFLEEGHCGAAAVELEPETGCATYSQADEAEAEEEWEDEFEDEFEDEEEDLYEDEEEDDDLWDDEDEEEEY
jgi:hypothetical protein